MKYLTESVISCKVPDCIIPHSHNSILTVLSVTIITTQVLPEPLAFALVLV